MSCLGGEVLDLSSTGLRIATKSKPEIRPGEVRRLSFGTDQQTLTLEARVVWIKREGLLSRKWTMGVQFIDGRAGVQRLVDRFARFGYLDQTAAAGDEPSTTETPAAAAPSPDAPQPHTIDDAPSVRIQPPDLYAVLGLTHEATEDDIRGAFRSLVRSLHPDSAHDGGDQERFETVQKAYQVLRDPDFRERYNLQFLDRAA